MGRRKIGSIRLLLSLAILNSVIDPSVWAKGGATEAVVKVFTVYNEYGYDKLCIMEQDQLRLLKGFTKIEPPFIVTSLLLHVSDRQSPCL